MTLSPLTSLESDNDIETPDPPPNPLARALGPDLLTKMTKHSCKQASGHGAHTYVAKPSTVKHHTDALQPLQVLIKVKSFPASASGSWVCKRSQGAKKEPWTIPELVSDGFVVAGKTCRSII